MRRSILPIIVTLSVACGGTETTVNTLHPDIAVAPESMDFGEVVVLYDDSQILQVVNAGRAPLHVSRVYVADNDDNVYSVTPESFDLDADASMGVQVDFTPATYLPYERTLVFESNDPDSPIKQVPLTGEGVDGPVPDISLDTQSLDFGTVDVSSTSTLYFGISNIGDGDLEITSTEQTGSGAFSLVNYPDGQTISADGGLFTAIVNYTPTQEGGDSGALTIHSSDPDEPDTQVLFLGNGGGEYEYPEAVIDCPDSVDPPVTIDLDGTDSNDPNGFEPLTYAWSLVSLPTGSTTSIAEPTDAYTSLFVDLAGDYEVQLKVTNSMGVESAPARCEFTATPADSLHVEMVWNTGNSDLDLHLIQDGYEFLEKPGDCCWCNPTPSWGESTTADDPELALDNRMGYGPENVRVESPVDGDYYVKVHYFEDDGGGTTTSTVRIWIDGVLEEELSESLTHNKVWDVGYVRWPEGVFVKQENDLYKPDTKECWE